MKIIDFCREHRACTAGREWALATGCKTMQGLWARKDVPHEWRIWIASRPGVMPERDARLFACWCVRRVWHLLTDERSREAVRVAERYARGKATKEELAAADSEAARVASAAAREAAWAASEAARAAAREAAWEAAGPARAAASAAARAAAWAASAAAWAAAREAAWEAAWSARTAAGAASCVAQARKLKSYQMNFGGYRENH